MISAACHVRDELTHFSEVFRSGPVETFEDQTVQLTLNFFERLEASAVDVRNVVIFTSSCGDTSGCVRDGLNRTRAFRTRETGDAVAVIHAAENKCVDQCCFRRY